MRSKLSFGFKATAAVSFFSALLAQIYPAYAADSLLQGDLQVLASELGREASSDTFPMPPDIKLLESELKPLAEADPATIRELEEVKNARFSDNTPRVRGPKENEIAGKGAPGVVYIQTTDSLGSGSILSADGLILTNYHVVQGFQTVSVHLHPIGDPVIDPANFLLAEVIKIDDLTDLALIKIVQPPEDLTVLEISTTGNPAIGDDVHAIGHPNADLWTYSRGYVSQVRPDYEFGDFGFNKYARIIQAQIPISPGNSGGPLLDENLKIVGVNSFVPIDPIYRGMSYAVAATEVNDFVSREGDRFLPGNLESLVRPNPRKLEHADRDNNGFSEVVYLDNTATGRFDTILVDEDENGIVDFVIIDRNENGLPDGVRRREDCDGESAFVWYFDNDENGTDDIRGCDLDRDGIVDVYQTADNQPPSDTDGVSRRLKRKVKTLGIGNQ